jgi:hypothetical protein
VNKNNNGRGEGEIWRNENTQKHMPSDRVNQKRISMTGGAYCFGKIDKWIGGRPGGRGSREMITVTQFVGFPPRSGTN